MATAMKFVHGISRKNVMALLGVWGVFCRNRSVESVRKIRTDYLRQHDDIRSGPWYARRKTDLVILTAYQSALLEQEELEFYELGNLTPEYPLIPRWILFMEEELLDLGFQLERVSVIIVSGCRVRVDYRLSWGQSIEERPESELEQ